VLHRLNALALVAALAWLAWLARAAPRIARLAGAGARLALLQIGLGALNVLLRLPVELTALHSALAAAIALVAALLVREAILSRVEVSDAWRRVVHAPAAGGLG
jgi:heme A synthase